MFIYQMKHNAHEAHLPYSKNIQILFKQNIQFRLCVFFLQMIQLKNVKLSSNQEQFQIWVTKQLIDKHFPSFSTLLHS